MDEFVFDVLDIETLKIEESLIRFAPRLFAKPGGAGFFFFFFCSWDEEETLTKTVSWLVS